nr:NAD(P)/FAD-dependent oxidoreductase [Pseudohoeflea sp. DP4N28-3]
MTYDVAILGAGAAGLMCAIEAGRRGRSVIVIDHARAPGEKIRISGGGRCNFTNIHSGPEHFLSDNPHFAKSALSAYRPRDFIAKVEQHGIAWHEKTLGQLFCDGSSKQIIAMLTDELAAAGGRLSLGDPIHDIAAASEGGFVLRTGSGRYQVTSLVVATGGKSIPKMGATGLGYDIASQFGHQLVAPRPGLVPFTWPSDMAGDWGKLSGVGLPVRTRVGKVQFDEQMLFTHRGLSGPAILQISSYWRDGEAIEIDLQPQLNLEQELIAARREGPKASVETVLAKCVPRRLAEQLAVDLGLSSQRLADLSNRHFAAISARVHRWAFRPGGSEGFRTAEVTLGGVATDGLSQSTMESRTVRGLFFIGEVVDVTGHLGGHNFHWAWASGFAAGRSV